MAGSVQKVVNPISAPAARDLSSYQYHAMKLDTSGNADYVDTSAAGTCMGILQNAPDAVGETAELASIGDRTLMRVDGNSVNIAIGALLGSNSSYHGVAVTIDGAVGFARAMEASTADGDLILVQFVGHQTLSVPGQ